MAALTMMAFSRAARVRISEGLRFARAMATMRLPLTWQSRRLRESGAGMAAPPGSVKPSASTTQAMLDAVPMVMQWPSLRDMQVSDSR